jgi:hypothetical protein
MSAQSSLMDVDCKEEHLTKQNDTKRHKQKNEKNNQIQYNTKKTRTPFLAIELLLLLLALPLVASVGTTSGS